MDRAYAQYRTYVSRACGAAKRRSQTKGVAFGISPALLQCCERARRGCFVFGKEFDFSGEHGTRMWGPSLDRFVPAQGYVFGNVDTISLRANLVKSDATADEMRRLAAFTAIYRAPERRDITDAALAFAKRRLAVVRSRAKQDGLVFQMTAEELASILHPSPLDPRPFDFDNPLSDDAPEVDQFLPGGGYVFGENVTVVSRRMNRIKGAWTHADFAAVNRWMDS